MGEVNKGAVALLLVLVLGAGGYLWYMQMYKPAVASKAAAETAATTAEASLSQAQQELNAAKEQIEAAKKESGKVDGAVSRLSKARTAIPAKDLIDDAAIVLMEHAERSGVNTNINAGNEEGAEIAAGGSDLQGATPIDLTFEAAGSWAEMQQFMTMVHSTVEEKDDKLYTRGRLFNVVRLEIGEQDDEDSTELSGSVDNEGPIVEKGDTVFTVVVRMYTSSTENAENVGESTPDAAAAPLEDGAGDSGTAAGEGAGAETGTEAPSDGTGAEGDEAAFASDGASTATTGAM